MKLHPHNYFQVLRVRLVAREHDEERWSSKSCTLERVMSCITHTYVKGTPRFSRSGQKDASIASNPLKGGEFFEQ